MLEAINYQITKAINLKTNGEEKETPDNLSALTLSKDFKFNSIPPLKKLGLFSFSFFLNQ
jgi:hypothetical protein